MSIEKLLNALHRQDERDSMLIELEPDLDERDIPDGLSSRQVGDPTIDHPTLLVSPFSSLVPLLYKINTKTERR